MAFLAVWLEHGLKREAIDGAFDRHHAPRAELRTRILRQGEKGPGVGLRALRRTEKFRFDSRAAALLNRARRGTENIGDHLAVTKSLFYRTLM